MAHADAFAWLAEKMTVDVEASLAMMHRTLGALRFDPRVLDADWKKN
ncbi:MAG: hypothetical protein IT381_30445 [Deltaproteobacteria bacterium]|nr:hypothetical protein [Deltaproteobacteria bacterium]